VAEKKKAFVNTVQNIQVTYSTRILGYLFLDS